jgi:hypothetical protein
MEDKIKGVDIKGLEKLEDNLTKALEGFEEMMDSLKMPNSEKNKIFNVVKAYSK